MAAYCVAPIICGGFLRARLVIDACPAVAMAGVRCARRVKPG